MTLLAGSATALGTRAYSARFPEADPGHFRPFFDLTASSIGLGTYLGGNDDATDDAVTASAAACLERGVNLIDTAINYRCMRGERSVGAALARLVGEGKVRREEAIVATKGGFIPFDGAPPKNPAQYVRERFVSSGLAREEEIVAGCHCLAPRYLSAQIEESRRNLGLETIDVYFLHNPETQLDELPRGEVFDRYRAAFEVLEAEVKAGRIKRYGMATWTALRGSPADATYLSLEEMVGLAHEVGGAGHHFKVVQLPYNLAMPEAYIVANQEVDGEAMSLLEAAQRLGVAVVASVPLYQGRVAKNLPQPIREKLGLDSDARRALQFVRSTPGVLAALAGMKRPEHLDDNLGVLTAPLADEAIIQSLFRR